MTFAELGLQPELLQALTESGYDQPTPIQEQAIPLLLSGRDVLGQAQTGTGKTAAFSLPMLQCLDLESNSLQALVLTPTRELASQVSNTIFRYGKYCDAKVLPIYGGTSYDRQFRRLEKGIHVVVGTPGRLLDLIERGALKLNTVRYLVLDEADEMLKMGFIDDVEKIMSNIPAANRQTALFSATLPAEIRRLAEKYMHSPVSVQIARGTLTVAQTEQRYYLVHADSRLAALSRLLETEKLQSALIFTRTRTGSAELAESLLERGYVADALHGELNQAAREAVLRRFRNGQLPILVATDVVARGVDISGVSHVFNYDMPYDPEDYVHRIGRTGRAGKSGIAITLVTPAERRRLVSLEAYTKQKIARHELPDVEAVMARREQLFAQKLDEVIQGTLLDEELVLVETLRLQGYEVAHLAAAAMRLAREKEALRPIDDLRPVREESDRRRTTTRQGSSSSSDRGERGGSDRSGSDRRDKPLRERRPEIRTGKEAGMVRLVLDRGYTHGIRPRDIVGAIASGSNIPGKSIGAIDIQDEVTYVDVSESHVDRVLSEMRQWRMRGKPVRLTRAEGDGSAGGSSGERRARRERSDRREREEREPSF